MNDYAEYIANCLSKSLNYSEYVAENIVKSIDYAEYLANILDSNYEKIKLRKLRKRKLDNIFNE